MPELKSQLIRPSALKPEDIAKWRSFLQASPSLAAPFLSYDYVATAERCFPDVRVAKFAENGETVGYFPFEYASTLHRLAGIGQRVSGDLADYFGLVASPGTTVSTSALLRATRLKALYFTNLEEAQTSFGLGGEQPEIGTRIEFPEGGEAFWTNRRTLDRKFVGDTERRERKLIEEHGPLRFVFRHEDCAGELQKLVGAKRRQYARTGVIDPLASAAKRRFLAALAVGDGPDCHATLSTLHAGDQWIGSHFGLMYGSTLHYWFPVYNPQMRNFGPGRLLIKAIIDSAGQNGVKAIDRGAGDSPAKRDFATSQHAFLRGLWTRPGPTSLAYRAVLSVQWRLQAERNKARAEASE